MINISTKHFEIKFEIILNIKLIINDKNYFIIINKLMSSDSLEGSHFLFSFRGANMNCRRSSINGSAVNRRHWSQVKIKLMLIMQRKILKDSICFNTVGSVSLVFFVFMQVLDPPICYEYNNCKNRRATTFESGRYSKVQDC